MLFVPGSNARALDKARTIHADALIFDLEDAVAPDAKIAARRLACAAIAEGGYGTRELTVRCNGLDTPWGVDDLAAAAAVAPAALVVPKVRGADDLHSVADLLERSGAPGYTRIWAMLETAAAILAAREIAAFPAVAAVVVGTNDLAADLRATSGPGRAALLPHLASALLGARAAGVTAIDGVYNDIGDDAGFEAECRQGAELGYDGKSLIYPSQVPIANRVWAPTADQVAHSRRVIDAYEAARLEHRGVATLDGVLIENMHVAHARRLIALAAAVSG